MSSKKEQKHKQKPEDLTFFAEEVEEIKEIVERRPEPRKQTIVPETWYGTLWKNVKHTVENVCVLFAKLFGKICRDAKSLGILAAAVGLGLLVTVIVLAVRLGGVSKELESVQAMSLGLQEELNVAKQELLENQKTLLSMERSAQEMLAVPTVTAIPTSTPIPTATPIVKKYVVCVDPGHGDWEGGAVYRDENGRELRAEKDDNLRMSKWFKAALEEYGVEVVLTRETDVYLKLKDRTAIANNANADALISFHRNSYGESADVCGIEFWIHSSQPQGAKMLAKSMLDAVMEVGGMVNRGVKYGSMSDFKEDYEINRSANMTSMIVEFGFISSAADNEAYDAHGKEYAAKMAKAVYEWLEAQAPETENNE